MEISKKKLPIPELIEKEKALIAAIDAIKEKYDGVFAELDCDLYVEYLWRGEYDKEYSEMDFNEENYVDGYVSRAYLTVKRRGEIDEESITVDDEGATEDELKLEREGLIAKAEDEKIIAYTEFMMVRIYKSFWIEHVSISDNASTVEADLEEFAQKLREKASEEG